MNKLIQSYITVLLLTFFSFNATSANAFSLEAFPPFQLTVGAGIGSDGITFPELGLQSGDFLINLRGNTTIFYYAGYEVGATWNLINSNYFSLGLRSGFGQGDWSDNIGESHTALYRVFTGPTAEVFIYEKMVGVVAETTLRKQWEVR